MSSAEPATSEDGLPLVPVGTRFGRRAPDYCRNCETVTEHTLVVVSHEWWDCFMCGASHYGEACEWACMRCDQPGDGFTRLLTMLARAGLEPEGVDG